MEWWCLSGQHICRHGMDVVETQTPSSHSVSSSSRSHIKIKLVQKEGNDMRNALTSLINWCPLASVFADQVSKHRISPHSVNSFLVGFQAPRLRRLVLDNPTFPIGPPSLTAHTGLTKLSLTWVHKSIYPRPEELLQWLLSVPQLEMLQICVKSPFAVGGKNITCANHHTYFIS